MMLSQKCQYALRGVFELARRYGEGPVKIHDIAEAQDIPPRFLENILNQLRQADLVASRRGRDGGYLLVKRPEEVTVAMVIRQVQGPVSIVDCQPGGGTSPCALQGDCVFLPVWEEARQAILRVYEQKTFADLVETDRQKNVDPLSMYTI